MLTEVISSQRGEYYISTNKKFLDLEVIHQFLCYDSYWAKGISMEIVKAMIENTALCYGVYRRNPEVDENAEQVGFARVVTDFARFSWLGDVFILPKYRGKGLSKWLVETIVDHPFLKGTSFNLSTKDAHKLYEKFGFELIDDAEYRMVRKINWAVLHEVYKSYKD